MSLFSSMEDERQRIDFEGVDDADPDMETDTRDAVANLDFETAERIVENQRRSSCQRLRTSSQQFVRESEEENQLIKEQVAKKREKLERNIDREVQEIRHKFQARFTSMSEEHRNEAEQIKRKWIKLHKHAENIANKKIGDLHYTSQLLGSFQSFKSAKQIRDETNAKRDEIIANQVRPGDTHFKKQFLAMIERHKEQYRALFDEMTKEIELVQERGRVQATKIDVEGKFGEALTPVNMLMNINKSNDFSLVEKQSMIANLPSPN